MAKNWWFKFETSKWRNDSALRRCSLETKGFWIECIAAMREAEVFELSGTIDEVARLVGCFPQEAMRCLVELQRTETADVTLGNSFVTVKSRYIAKEVKVKSQTNLRVQRHRSNADVTHDVTLQSKSKSKNKRVSKKPPQTLEDLIAEQEANPDFAQIDVREEAERAADWIAKKPDRKFTKRFFVGWLKRADVPIEIPQKTKSQAADMLDPYGRAIGTFGR